MIMIVFPLFLLLLLLHHNILLLIFPSILPNYAIMLSLDMNDNSGSETWFDMQHLAAQVKLCCVENPASGLSHIQLADVREQSLSNLSGTGFSSSTCTTTCVELLHDSFK